VADVICSLPSYIYLGVNGDQEYEYTSHPVGEPTVNSARNVMDLTYTVAFPFPHRGDRLRRVQRADRRRQHLRGHRAAAVQRLVTSAVTAAVFVGLGLAFTASTAAAQTATQTSTSYAGYIAAMPFYKSGGKVGVPKIYCNNQSSGTVQVEAIFNGLDAAAAPTESGMILDLSCSGTVPNYAAELLIDGGQVVGPMSVQPHDQLVFNGHAHTTSESYSLEDQTHGGSLQGTGNGMVTQSVGYLVVGEGAFPTFGPSAFWGIGVNGQRFATTNPTAYDQVDGSGNTEIAAGPLNTFANGCHSYCTGLQFKFNYVSNS
jgi:hypothetical protein